MQIESFCFRSLDFDLVRSNGKIRWTPSFLIEYFDHIVHNVVFESLVLNVYGNSLITLSSKTMVYSSFHAYVIDIVNNVIINVSIKGACRKTRVEVIKIV
jgi:hypothetical protein